MPKPRLTFTTLALLLLGVPAARAAEPVVTEGIATIEGGDVAAAREAALRSAQRAAIEQVVGAVIESRFSAEQRESYAGGKSELSSVVEDKIVALAQGFVRSYEVVGERQEGTSYRVSIRAEVDRDSVAEQLEALDALMREAGYPKAVVLAAERYTGADKRAVWLEHPVAPALLERGLMDAGLPLVAADQGALRGRSSEALGELVQDPRKAAQLAAEQGGDIAVVGLADAVWSAHEDGLHYVAMTFKAHAVRSRTGEVLATTTLTSRQVGVSEELARQNAANAGAPKVVEALLAQIGKTWRAEVARGTAQRVRTQLAPGLGLVSELPEATVVGGGKEALRGPAREVVLEAQGPAVLQLDWRVLGAGAAFKDSHGELVVTRLGAGESRYAFAAKTPKGKKPPKVGTRSVSMPLRRQLEVPAGVHRYRITFGAEVVLGLEVERAAAKPLLLPAETPLAPPKPVELEAITVARKESSTRDPAVVPAPAPSPTPAASPTAAPRETNVETVRPADGSVNAAAAALAEALLQRFRDQGGQVAFHRTAIPPFTALGAAQEDNMGLLVSEMLGVELGQRPPFVVLERERMSSIMREHRLKDLGVLDPGGAAQFGKLLGAQSLMLGTIGEAGPDLVVTVRQVDVESGRAVAAAQVNIDRAGLVALSSDAVVLRSKSGSLFRSLVFPGWGQFYNREPVKGAAFAAAGAGTLGALAFFATSGMQAKSRYESNRPGTVDDRALANDRLRVANVLLVAYGVVWAVGAIDAYLSGADATDFELPTTQAAD